jgi:hypothetical protein
MGRFPQMIRAYHRGSAFNHGDQAPRESRVIARTESVQENFKHGAPQGAAGGRFAARTSLGRPERPSADSGPFPILHNASKAHRGRRLNEF